MSSSLPTFTFPTVWCSCGKPMFMTCNASFDNPFFSDISNEVAYYAHFLDLQVNVYKSSITRDNNDLGFPKKEHLPKGKFPEGNLTLEQINYLTNSYLAFVKENYDEAKEHWLKFCSTY